MPARPPPPRKLRVPVPSAMAAARRAPTLPALASRGASRRPLVHQSIAAKSSSYGNDPGPSSSEEGEELDELNEELQELAAFALEENEGNVTSAASQLYQKDATEDVKADPSKGQVVTDALNQIESLRAAEQDQLDKAYELLEKLGINMDEFENPGNEQDDSS